MQTSRVQLIGYLIHKAPSHSLIGVVRQESGYAVARSRFHFSDFFFLEIFNKSKRAVIFHVLIHRAVILTRKQHISCPSKERAVT